MCAFFVCFLSVLGSVPGFHVYFRSPLDLVFAYSRVSYPGPPSSCGLDAIRFFSSDINLEDWMVKFHISSQGLAAGGRGQRGAFCAVSVSPLICWHSTADVYCSSWPLPCSPACYVWEMLRPVMGKAGLNGLC